LKSERGRCQPAGAGTRSRTASDLREGLAWRRKLLRSRSKPANRHVFCMAAEFVSRGGSGAFEVLSFGRRGYGMHLIAMHQWPIQFDLVRERQSSTTPSRRYITARPPRQRFLIGGCGCQRRPLRAGSGLSASGNIAGQSRHRVRSTARLLPDPEQKSGRPQLNATSRLSRIWYRIRAYDACRTILTMIAATALLAACSTMPDPA
jgi:hypothetical protein